MKGEVDFVEQPDSTTEICFRGLPVGRLHQCPNNGQYPYWRSPWISRPSPVPKTPGARTNRGRGYAAGFMEVSRQCFKGEHPSALRCPMPVDREKADQLALESSFPQHVRIYRRCRKLWEAYLGESASADGADRFGSGRSDPDNGNRARPEPLQRKVQGLNPLPGEATHHRRWRRCHLRRRPDFATIKALKRMPLLIMLDIGEDIFVSVFNFLNINGLRWNFCYFFIP
ncbi:MAG: hypothetical protein M2R45_01446 [Verrucomicrobia subdivision 3 bacterium]|nr:hypothetical protein [Limisphaerales bacterium]MCS1417609.1 hypothetical protein [Limisphaerales bacterium]